jgi:hypothetical protein
MSHHTLQKLVVRMLWDETFVAAVQATPDQALKGLELTEAERAQLLAVDRRAWRHDQLRRKRTLRTLAEEFKVSTTIILAETRSLASLEHFFSSSFFHQAVQQRGSLGLSFSEFLLDGCRNSAWRAPQITDIVRLEAAVAACRRTLAREGAYEPAELPATINDRAQVRLAPGYGVASFQANVIEAIQTVEQYLFELSLMPAMALCDDAPQLPPLPEVESKRKLYLLFSPGATGISLTHVDKPTWAVLGEAKRPTGIRSLLSRAAMTGVKAPQAQEILAEWLECGGLMLMKSVE